MSQGSAGYGGPNFSQIEGSLRNVAVQFTSILALQRQIGASVDAWRQLERQLALSSAAAGGTAAEFKDMERAARNFALSTSYSASQVANAFYNLASAGFSVKETLSAATGVVLLAQATLTDLGEASDIVASSLAQFNLNAAESYRVANLFVAATNSSLATVPKLAFALRQVGPIATQVGMSIEQTVGALDKLFDAGLRGEQAGTALRNAIARIMDPMGQGRMLLQNLGVTAVDKMTGQMRNPLEIFKELAKLNLNQADIANISGIEAAAGFTTMLKSLRTEVGATNTEMETHIKQITGTTAAYKMSVIQMQTLDGQLKLMGNSFNDMRITLGQGLAPALADLSQWVQDLALSMKSLDQAELLQIGRMGLYIVAAFGALKAVSALTKSFIAFRKSMVAMAEAKATIDALGATATAAQSAAAGTTLLASRLALLGTGVGVIAVIAGITAGVVALGAALRHTEKAIDSAKIDQLAGHVYQRFAQKTPGLTPEQQAALSDQNNYSEQLERNLRDVPLKTPVDAATGSGAGTRYSIISDIIDSTANDQRQIKMKLQAFVQQYNENKPAIEAGIQSLQGFNNALSNAVLLVAKSNNGPVELNADQIKQATKSQADSLEASLRKLARASDADLPKAIQEFYLERKAAIEKAPNLAKEQKQVLLNSLANGVKALQSANTEVQIGYRDMLLKGFSKVNANTFNANGEELAGKYSDFLGKTLDSMQTYLLGDENGVAQRIKDLEDKFRQSGGTNKKAWSDLNDTLGLVGKETVSNLVQTARLTDEQRKQVLDYTNREFAKPGGGALAGTLDMLRKSRGNEQMAMPVLVEALSHYFNFGPVWTEALQRTKMTAILSQQKVAEETRKLQLDLISSQVDLIIAQQPNADVSGLLSEQFAAQKEQVLPQVVGELTQEIAKNQPAYQQMVADLSNSQLKTLENALDSAAPKNDKEWYDLTERVMKVISPSGNNNITNILIQAVRNSKDEITVMRRKVEAERLNAMRSNEQRHMQISVDEQFIRDLAGLPSAEELYLQSEKVRQEARYRMSEYLQMPFAAIEKARVDLQITMRQQAIDFQKKNRKQFTDTIAKGLDNVVSDENLVSAYSGQLIQKILGSDQPTDVYGTQFTKEFLRTSEGMQKFVEVVSGEFEKLARAQGGDQKALESRINTARRVLLGAGNEMVAFYDDFNAQLIVLEQRAADTRRKAEAFIQNFEQQSIVDAFTTALKAMGDDPTRVDLTIDIALNAKVAQIKIDAETTYQQLIDKYTELFRQKDIPVVFDMQTGQFKMATGTSAAPAVIGIPVAPTTAVPDQSPYYSNIPQREASFQPIVGAKLEEMLINTLKAVVKNPYGISAVLATSRAENSKFDPRQSNMAGSGAYGFAQWFADRKGALFDYARKSGMDPGSEQAQISFWLKEMTGQFKSILNRLQNAGSPKEALDAYMDFEKTDGWRRGRPEGSIYYGRAGRYQQDYLNRAGVGGGVGTAIGPDAPVTPVALPPALSAAQLADQQAQIDRFNAMLAAQKDGLDREAANFTKFLADNPEFANAMGLKIIGDAYGEAYDRYSGAALTAQSERFSNLAARATGYGTAINMGMGAEASPEMVQLSRRMTLETQLNTLQSERLNLVNQTRRATEIEIAMLQGQANSLDKGSAEYLSTMDKIHALAADQADIERRITEEYERRAMIAADPSHADNVRQMIQNQMANNAAEFNTFTNNDPMDGLRQAVLSFANEIPTVFETMRDTAVTALQGISDIGAGILTGSEDNARQAVANMLRAMAQLMAKMVIMYALMQLIRAIPGGSALLSALDFASGAASAVGGGVNGGHFTSSNPGVGYAKGGVARSPQLALFGEGRTPEAYIPMEDHRSIPVRIDDKGNAYVPLPSGQIIPVSLQNSRKRFALGGVGGYSKPRAFRADAAMASAHEAVAPYRGVANVSNKTEINIPVTIQGNANENDANEIGRQIAKHVDAALKEREQETARQFQRRAGTVGASYGVQ